MKYNKIMVMFGVGLVSCVVLRILQLFFVVDTVTGFFKKEFETVGNIMLVAVFVIALAAAFFAFTAHRSPEQPPRTNKILGIAAFLPAVSLVYQILGESFPASVQPWQLTLLKLTGLASALFFVLFGLKAFVKIPLFKGMFVLPVMYFIMRVICDFTVVSSLALISDNLLLITAYCTVLWFMLQFAKLYNSADNEYGFRRLMAGGILSVILCFTQSVPHIIVNFYTKNSYLHTSFEANLNLLFMGAFILVFMIFHFSHKNSCELIEN